MSFPRGVRGIGKGIGVGFFRTPANSQFLPSVITTACRKGYRSYTPANERTSRPTPNCHCSKGPPRELWPYQSYGAGTIIISICGFIFSAQMVNGLIWVFM